MWSEHDTDRPTVEQAARNARAKRLDAERSRRDVALVVALVQLRDTVPITPSTG